MFRDTFTIALYKVCLYSALYSFDCLLSHLLHFIDFVYLQEHFKKTYFHMLFSNTTQGHEKIGRRLRQKFCLTMTYEAIWKTYTPNMSFIQLNSWLFPKWREIASYNEVFILYFPSENESDAGFQKPFWSTGIYHIFIYKGIHSYGSPSCPVFLYTYLKPGVVEGLKGSSFMVLA